VLDFKSKYRVIDGIKEITEALNNGKFQDTYSAIYKNVI
jgi:hypothetical protein